MIGGLALIGGVTAIVADLALLLVGKPNALPAAAAASPLLAAAFVLAAVVLILLGQIATATFAIAAASKATPSDHTDA